MLRHCPTQSTKAVTWHWCDTRDLLQYIRRPRIIRNRGSTSSQNPMSQASSPACGCDFESVCEVSLGGARWCSLVRIDLRWNHELEYPLHCLHVSPMPRSCHNYFQEGYNVFPGGRHQVQKALASRNHLLRTNFPYWIESRKDVLPTRLSTDQYVPSNRVYTPHTDEWPEGHQFRSNLWRMGDWLTKGRIWCLYDRMVSW